MSKEILGRCEANKLFYEKDIQEDYMKLMVHLRRWKRKKKEKEAPFHYTPVEDGTYYGITRGGRASVWAGGVQFFVQSISPKLL